MKTPYNLKIYLDTCCLNRPFNDQTQAQIRRETEAIQTLLKYCFTEQWLWITSDVLIFEINNTPNQIQRDYMRTQLNRAYQNISIDAIENTRGQELEALGFKWFDALHLACAESSKADVFLTTDNRLIRRANRVRALLQVRVDNPYIWLQEVVRMNVLEMTNIEFFELGIKTLLEKLGPTGVSRFLRQCEPGTGDYAIERHEWLDKINRETGFKEIKKIQNAREAGQSDRKFASLAKTILAGERKLMPKKVQKLTDMELYELAVEILTEKLSPGGLIGFFLQCNLVTGDCSVNRHTWLDKLDNGRVLKEIHTHTEKHNH